MVAVEHRAGLVSRDLHGDTYRNPEVNEIADGAPSHIVPQHSDEPRPLARRRPAIAEVANGVARVPPFEVWEQYRDHAVEVSGKLPHALDLRREQRFEFRREMNLASFASFWWCRGRAVACQRSDPPDSA